MTMQMRRGLTLGSTALALFLAGCFEDTKGGGSGGTDGGTESTGSTGTTDPTAATDSAGTGTGTTGATDSATTTDSAGSTTGSCVGEEGCPCDAGGECDPGLACEAEVCIVTVCGDGDAEGDEVCDDGNTDDGDGCDADCTRTEILRVDASYQNTCALIEGGRVRCWGYNIAGQLGYGNTDSIGDDETPADAGDVMLPVAAIQLTMGDQHSCVRLDGDTARCWGTNFSGQLGYANTENVGDDEFPINIQDIMVGKPVVEIAAGGSHSCIRANDGKVRCWGAGASGQLGYGNPDSVGATNHPSTAGDVPVGAAVIKIATGIGHTCAVLSNDEVKCWGTAFSGQLGYGNQDVIGDTETPAAVGTVATGGKVREVVAGLSHTCALRQDDSVLCWGANSSGQLGQGNVDNLGDTELPDTASAIDVGGDVAQLTVGDNHNCVLRTDGEVVCWGANSFGQLGLGHTDTIGDDELPVAGGTVDVGGNVLQIDAGGNHTCVVLETHEVVCWGYGGFGQLGYGNTDNVGHDGPPSAAGAIELL